MKFLSQRLSRALLVLGMLSPLSAVHAANTANVTIYKYNGSSYTTSNLGTSPATSLAPGQRVRVVVDTQFDSSTAGTTNLPGTQLAAALSGNLSLVAGTITGGGMSVGSNTYGWIPLTTPPTTLATLPSATGTEIATWNTANPSTSTVANKTAGYLMPKIGVDAFVGGGTLGAPLIIPSSHIQGTGDGFAPQPFTNGDGNPSIMVISHHTQNANYGALDLITGVNMPPLPYSTYATSYGIGSTLYTSNSFEYAQDTVSKKFYYPAYDTSGKAAIGCIDGSFKPSLGQHPTTCTTLYPTVASGTTVTGVNNGLTADGLLYSAGQLFMAVGTSGNKLQITCTNTSDGSNCAGYPFIAATDYVSTGTNNVRFQALDNTKFAVGYNSSTGVRAVCFDASLGTSCGSVGTTDTNITSQPMGVFDSFGTLTGFCAFTVANPSSTQCKALDGSWTRSTSMPNSNLGIPYYGTVTKMPGTGRYYVSALGGPTNMYCFDMEQGGASCGTTSTSPVSGTTVYGTSFYENPSTGDLCFFTYNDPAILGVYQTDRTTGALTLNMSCAAPGGAYDTFAVSNPSPQFCTSNVALNWSTITVTLGQAQLYNSSGVAGNSAALYGGKVEILDPTSGNVIGRQLFTAAQSANPIVLNAAALGLQYASQNNFNLRVTLLQDNGNNLRVGYVVPATVEVDYTATKADGTNASSCVAFDATVANACGSSGAVQVSSYVSNGVTVSGTLSGANSNLACTAALTVNKSLPSPQLQNGQASTYTITLNNTSSSAIASGSVKFSDALPPGLDFAGLNSNAWSCVDANSNPVTNATSPVGVLTCSYNGSLAAGTSASVGMLVKPNGLTANSPVTNYASVAETGGTPASPASCAPGALCATATAQLVSSPLLSVAKTSMPPLTTGTESTYGVTVSNAAAANGATTTAGSGVVVAESIPSGVNLTSIAGSGWSCVNAATTTAVSPSAGSPVAGPVLLNCTQLNALAAGSSTTALTLGVTPLTGTTSVTTYSSVSPTGLLTPPTTGPTCPAVSGSASACASNTAFLSGQPPSLVVSKTALPALTVGNAVTYNVSVLNVGGSAATTATVNESIPAGVTLNSIGSAGNGWYCTQTNGAPLTLPSSGAVNAKCSYTSSIAVGATSQTLPVSITLQQGTTFVQTFSTVDPSGGSNPATAANCVLSSTCATNIGGAGVLSITKSPLPVVGTGGANASYNVTVQNGTPAQINTASIQEFIPTGVTLNAIGGNGWTCQNAALPITAGSSGLAVPCEYVGTVASGSLTPSMPVNIKLPSGVASVTTYSSVDSLAGQNPPTANGCTTPGVCASNTSKMVLLSVTKSTLPAITSANASTSYTVTVSNASGAATASNATVLESIPAGVSLSAIGGGSSFWTCTNNSGGGALSLPVTGPVVAKCVYGNSTAAGANTLPLPVTVVPASSVASYATFTALDPTGGSSPVTPGSTCPSTAPTSTSCATNSSAVGSPNLSITKDALSIGFATPASYALHILNSGNGPAAGATIFEQIPSGVSVTGITGTGWACVDGTTGAGLVFPLSGSARIECVLGSSIAAGATNSGLQFSILPAAGTTSVTTYSSVDPTAGNAPTVPGADCTRYAPAASACASNTATTPIDLQIVQSALPNLLTAGTAVPYTLTVKNAGGAAASGATVLATIPAGVALTSVGTTGWTCTNTDGTALTLPTAGSAALTVKCASSAALAIGASATAIPVSVTPNASGTGITQPPSIVNLYAAVDPLGTASPPTPGATCVSAANPAVPATACAAGASPMNGAPVAVTLSKTSLPARLAPGATAAYSVSVSNAGGSSWTTPTVIESIPAGVTVSTLGSSASGWTCKDSATSTTNYTTGVPVTGPITAKCTSGSALAANSTATALPVVIAGAIGTTSITTYSAVDPVGGTSYATPGASCTPSTACASNTTALPDLSVSKTTLSNLLLNQSSSYSVTVSNSGTAISSAPTVYEYIPSGASVTAIGGGTSGWTCTTTAGAALSLPVNGATTIKCVSTSGLNPGATSTALPVSMTPVSGTTLSMVSTVDQGDGNQPTVTTAGSCTGVSPAASCASNGGSITKPPLLSVAKTSITGATAGNAVAYTVTVSNAASTTSYGPAAGATLLESIPAGMRLNSIGGGSSGWSCTLPGGGALYLPAIGPLTARCVSSASIANGASASTLSVNVSLVGATVGQSLLTFTTVDPLGGSNPATPPTQTSACTASSCAYNSTGTTAAGNNPTLSLGFSPATIGIGGKSTLTLSIDNPTAQTLTETGLNLALPSGMSAASPVGLTSTCGGNVRLSNNHIVLLDGTLPAGQSCQITAQVTSASASGTVLTATEAVGALTDDQNLSNTAAASATLTIQGGFGVTTNFAQSTVLSGGTVNLTITLNNTGSNAISSLALTDVLPTAPGAMTVAAVPALANTCGGSVTANSGDAQIVLTGGSLAAQSSCSITVAVTASTSGNYVNAIAANSITGQRGSAALEANPAAQAMVVFQSNPSSITGTVRRSGAALQGVGVTLYDGRGRVVAVANTAADGSYFFSNLPPSLSGDPESAYSVVFGSASGVAGLPKGVPENTNASLNGTANSNAIVNIVAVAGAAITQQDATFIDPSGVVYDSLARTVVPGVQVTIVDPSGTVVPNSALDTVNGTTNGAPTGANGEYALFVSSAYLTAHPGAYKLQLVVPSGYTQPAAGAIATSTLIAPAAASYTPPTGSGSVLIQAQTTAPTGTQPVTYYTVLNLSATTQGVANNHLPIDPAVLLSISNSTLSGLTLGTAASYTVTVNNNGGAAASGATVLESIPTGVALNSIGGGSSGWTCTNTDGSALSLPANGPITVKCTSTATIAAASASVPIPVSVTPALNTLGQTLAFYSSVDITGGGNPQTPQAPSSCTPSTACAQSTAAVSPGTGVFFLQKSGSVQNVELGDSMQYTLTLKLVSGTAQPSVVIADTLPRGFKYIPGTASAAFSGSSTATLNTDTALGLHGVGPVLDFALGTMQAGDTVTLTYRVRVGVGAQQGDAINRAQASSTVSGSRSNLASYGVQVTGGVFAQEGCVIGKVYMDCDGNGVQNGPHELGIPGVRMYFENGNYLISDSEGKYSMCGLPATTHVLKVDETTLPKGAKLELSSSRNAGDPGSLFVDLQFGELFRADFPVAGCPVDVSRQVVERRRRAQNRSGKKPAAASAAAQAAQPPVAAPASQPANAKPGYRFMSSPQH